MLLCDVSLRGPLCNDNLILHLKLIELISANASFGIININASLRYGLIIIIVYLLFYEICLISTVRIFRSDVVFVFRIGEY